jgi:hypothetical protein
MGGVLSQGRDYWQMGNARFGWIFHHLTRKGGVPTPPLQQSYPLSFALVR